MWIIRFRGMDIALITFDGFTDIDLFLPWDLLHRPQDPSWRIRILGTAAEHVSNTGLAVRCHASIDEARNADVVLIGSGQATRGLIADPQWLGRLQLDPSRQMIGSMCAGALVLAALGLLDGLSATTYPTAAAELRAYGIDVVEAPFVQHGNIATAAGCLAAQQLCSWIVDTTLGPEARRRMLLAVQPVGHGLTFADADTVGAAYASDVDSLSSVPS
jgi:transcriptional regulator GlxA family with amidase domain